MLHGRRAAVEVGKELHFEIWYAASHPTALAWRTVTFPGSAPLARAASGAELPACNVWDLPSFQSRRASSTRAVSSPQSSDWRACLAVQSGPTRLHRRDPSCGRFAANAPTRDPRRNEPGPSHGRVQGSRILESDHGPRSALRKIAACRPGPREPRFSFRNWAADPLENCATEGSEETRSVILSREEQCGFIIPPRREKSALTTSAHVGQLRRTILAQPLIDTGIAMLVSSQPIFYPCPVPVCAGIMRSMHGNHLPQQLLLAAFSMGRTFLAGN
jgi:hypothetical protein